MSIHPTRKFNPRCASGSRRNRGNPAFHHAFPPVLLKNNGGIGNHWLGINLVGKTCNRDAVGARISWQAGDLKRSSAGRIGSYLSSCDPRIVLGIGQRSKMDRVEVRWPRPSTLVQRYADLPIDRYVSLVEGDEKWK